jgi:hypothetical protein
VLPENNLAGVVRQSTFKTFETGFEGFEGGWPPDNFATLKKILGFNFRGFFI